MFDREKEIPIASDHAGFPMKEYLRKALGNRGFKIRDMGTYNEESTDYPDFIHPLAKLVDNGSYELGIIICGSGNGAQMVANKYPGVRAALCWTDEQAGLARMHNDANIISVPGRYVEEELALEMVLTFLKTDFEGGRHERRVKKIPETL
jgi:ribose 5-phosphate isomerase B